MRDALPNASFVGFMGTPVESSDKNTPAVFGDYIDIYDMTQAVEDGSTVKIYYESRIIKLDLPKGLDIDTEYDEITEFQEQTNRERLKSKWSRLEAMFGKAMIVVMSHRIAIELYSEIVNIRPDWHSDEDDKGIIKIVMTGTSSDPEHWQPFIGNKNDAINWHDV